MIVVFINKGVIRSGNHNSRVSRIGKDEIKALTICIVYIPKTHEDVITTVKSMELTTNKGENFLLLASEVKRIIIFSCFTNLYFLCQVDNIYVDGTFQYCSNFFFKCLHCMASKMSIMYIMYYRGHPKVNGFF
jgi:hypothetical protein